MGECQGLDRLGVERDERRQWHRLTVDGGFAHTAWRTCQTSPAGREDLEDHLVGIELREELRDLLLAEGIRKRGVDGLRLDAEPGRGVAIDCEGDGRSVRLLIGRKIGDLRDGLELGKSRSTMYSVHRTAILERVLEQPLDCRPPMVMSCAGCMIEARALHPGELRPQAVHDLHRVRAAFVERLQAA